ncbi:MAG: hypothetical protein JW951_08455, partial [Lentisphaerae bacterium]|nr:hypothetical protein [Lentisphaerota bacterium]
MRLALAALALILIITLPGLPPAHAQKFGADITSLAAITLADSPGALGVYLGHGLLLTPWHPWTLDGAYVSSEESPLSPSQQAVAYDADSADDPGERVLSMAVCGAAWTASAEAGPDCTPFARLNGATAAFPLAGNAVPVPVGRLLYASRDADIALFEIDAGAVEAQGVQPARLSLIP